MNEAVINKNRIGQDLRSLIGRVRIFRGKLQKTFKAEDLRTRLVNFFETEGLDYDVADDGKHFSKDLNASFRITGRLEKRVYKIYFEFEYNGVKLTSENAQGGSVDIDMDRLELYGPLFKKIEDEGMLLTKQYDNLMKDQKGLELFESIIRSYLEERSVTDVVVKAIDSKKNQYIIKKKILGITIYAEIDFSNYESVCDSFIETLNRFPADFPNRSDFRIEWECNDLRVRHRYINPLTIPDDFKMVYADDMVLPDNTPAQIPDTSVLDTLIQYGYKFSYGTETATYEILLNKKLRLFWNENYLWFSFTKPDNSSDNLDAISSVDSDSFAILLKLLAMASQNGGLKVNYTEFKELRSSEKLISKFVTVLFPDNITWGNFENRLYIDNLSLIRRNIRFSNTINDIADLIMNPRLFKSLRDFWGKEPKDSCIKIAISPYMTYGDFFDLKAQKPLWNLLVWGEKLYGDL